MSNEVWLSSLLNLSKFLKSQHFHKFLIFGRCTRFWWQDALVWQGRPQLSFQSAVPSCIGETSRAMAGQQTPPTETPFYVVLWNPAIKTRHECNKTKQLPNRQEQRAVYSLLRKQLNRSKQSTVSQQQFSRTKLRAAKLLHNSLQSRCTDAEHKAHKDGRHTARLQPGGRPINQFKVEKSGTSPQICYGLQQHDVAR